MALDVPNTLSKDLGPLPVWGWAVVVVGGVSIGVLIRRRSSGARPTTATVSPGDAGATAYEAYGGYTQSGTLSGAGGGAVNLSTPTITTNTQWRSAALTSALANGYTASAADQILSDYLAGYPLDNDAQALLDKVLPIIGLPPSPPTIEGKPAPAAPTPNPPEADPYFVDSASAVVEKAYSDILGRTSKGDPGALYWAQQLRSGGLDEATLRAQISRSTEAKSKAPAPASAAVERAYLDILGRTSKGDAGAAYWVAQMQSGRIDEAGLRYNLSQSQEARNKG